MRGTLKFIALLTIASIIFSCDSHQKREIKFDNGQLQEQFFVLETNDGSFKKDGNYKTWYSNGQQKSDGKYEQDQKVGNWKYWYENGQIQKSFYCIRDTIDGDYKVWYENGQQEIEGKFIMGKEFGSWVSWYKNSKMKKKLSYGQDGKNDGLQTVYYEDGQKKYEENYLKGVKEGENNYWNTEGKICVVRYFKNGIDTNLPANYINVKNGHRLELMTDDSYRFLPKSGWSQDVYQGKFQVDYSACVDRDDECGYSSDLLLRFKASRYEMNDWRIEKFTPDTIKFDDSDYFLRIENNPSTTATEGTVIGNLEWFTKNLDVDHFDTGEIIPHAKTNEELVEASNNKQPAWCYFDNDPANGDEYGKLYNWFAVSDPNGLCPLGWHVPSLKELKDLTNLLGASAGVYLKAKISWKKNVNDTNGIDSINFSGLPGGYRWVNGRYNSLGEKGSWWSSTSPVEEEAYTFDLFWESTALGIIGSNKGAGHSVRCVRTVE